MSEKSIQELKEIAQKSTECMTTEEFLDFKEFCYKRSDNRTLSVSAPSRECANWLRAVHFTGEYTEIESIKDVDDRFFLNMSEGAT